MNFDNDGSRSISELDRLYRKTGKMTIPIRINKARVQLKQILEVR